MVRPLKPYAPASFSASGKESSSHGAEAVVVEQLLPLADHAQIAVVHDDDLDRQAVAGDGGEFRDRHLETAIAADGEDQFVGPGELRADGGGEVRSPWSRGRRS